MSKLTSRLPIFGLLVCLSCVNAAAAGPVERVLHKFTGAPDGMTPMGALVADKNGNLYGTTPRGGNPGGGGENLGFGVVFELTPPGRSRWCVE
jgi:hypothetical protein